MGESGRVCGKEKMDPFLPGSRTSATPWQYSPLEAAMVRKGSRLMKQEGEWGVEGVEQKKFREGDK